jgi:hypothetical protein
MQHAPIPAHSIEHRAISPLQIGGTLYNIAEPWIHWVLRLKYFDPDSWCASQVEPTVDRVENRSLHLLNNQPKK